MHHNRRKEWRMRETAMYDLYDEGEYAGRYPIAALALMLGIKHSHTVSHYARTGKTYCKRYQFERVDEPIGADLAEEWDKERQSFLRERRQCRWERLGH